jgi:hypothetical protein
LVVTRGTEDPVDDARPERRPDIFIRHRAVVVEEPLGLGRLEVPELGGEPGLREDLEHLGEVVALGRPPSSTLSTRLSYAHAESVRGQRASAGRKSGSPVTSSKTVQPSAQMSTAEVHCERAVS